MWNTPDHSREEERNTRMFTEAKPTTRKSDYILNTATEEKTQDLLLSLSLSLPTLSSTLLQTHNFSRVSMAIT